MASELVVPVVRVSNVRAHPNADKLDVCDVLGYQMCVPKGKYVGGEMSVYFPADTLLPAEWADKFGVRNYLKGKDKDRVGRVRLRGEPSFGLVVGIPEGQDWKEGDNVASFYGCGKYEPPVKVGCGDAAQYDEQIDPYFEKFTDVQNGRIFTDVLKDGEEVIFTEKIHGCFRHDAKVMLANGEERPISEIKGGDSVLTMNEETGETEVGRVASVLVQKPRDSRWMKLSFDNGREVVCTEEHLFMTANRGWVKAGCLEREDELMEICL
jgi:RNA ligase (TIGR02306 family)